MPEGWVLPLRSLGALRVGAVGYGAMVLSPGLYGPIDDDAAAAALHHVLDAGLVLVDTSDSYGPDGHNERLVGRVVAARRRDAVVATKFGFRPPAGVERHEFPVGYSFGRLAVNAEPQYVRGYAEASLARLGIDVIDLWYPHFPDPAVPIEETVGAMADVVAAGLVRHLGLSNVTAEQLDRALGVHPIAAVQVEWSMWHPPDPRLVDVARRHGVGVVAWAPLGGGFLTGALGELAAHDYRRSVPRYEATNLAVNRDRHAPIRALAAEFGLSPGQLALAWLLHQDPSVVPIPGSRTPAHIDENLAAVAVALDGETSARIDAALACFRPVGAPLLDPALGNVGRAGAGS